LAAAGRKWPRRREHFFANHIRVETVSRAIITPPLGPLRRTFSLPGDKSVSHRRALLSLFTTDEVRLENFASGADAQTTLACLEQLGKTVKRPARDVVIGGKAASHEAVLDCGNSATTARLLMGILAARAGQWTLVGDASLSRRPMERVAEPLQRMGAQIELTDGSLPARIKGCALHGIEYDSPVASAQVKSAVLLAAMQAEGSTRYQEPLPTRDHTERLLGLRAEAGGWIAMNPAAIALNAVMLSGAIPGDISTAMFWMAATLLVPNSEMVVYDVLMNPRRSAHVDLLEEAGAEIEISNRGFISGEETANIAVRYSLLKPLAAAGARSAAMMDEVPMLAVLATRATGFSEFRDVRELRVKEADRLHLSALNLQRMGAQVHETEDALMVEGRQALSGAEIITDGDHRIALAFAAAGLSARGATIIHDIECVRISYPEFWDELEEMAPGTVRFES
jgi:3-phosphoshikimate 1-carboxyvinyltransferase